MTQRKYTEERGTYESRKDWLKSRHNTKPREKKKKAEMTVPSFIKIKKK